ncbi:MAG: hypothetical protein IT285_04585 [Bdellovibrionales bacterium]|nr:hypothetical protein [Bdellovibrionales bacterium]
MPSAPALPELSPDKVPVVVVEPATDLVRKVVEELKQRDDVQILSCASTLEALPLLRQLGGGVLVLCMGDRETVVKQVSLLKMLGKFLRRGTLKAVSTSQASHRPLYSLYAKHGLNEVVEEPARPRTLLMKLERLIGRLARRLASKQAAKKEAATGKKRSGSAWRDRRAEEAGGKGRSGEATQRFVDPLGIESDFWVAMGGSARQVMGRWMVKLIGPAPTVGRWVETETDSDEESHEKYYEWVPNNAEDATFLKEQGAWFFLGHKPEFHDERWTFVGKRPELAFYYESQNHGSKIATDEGGHLLVAKDSEAAKKLMPAILKTFERVIRSELQKDQGKDFLLEGAETRPDYAQGDLSPDVEAPGREDYVAQAEGPSGEFSDLRGDDPEAAAWNDSRENEEVQPSEEKDDAEEGEAGLWDTRPRRKRASPAKGERTEDEGPELSQAGAGAGPRGKRPGKGGPETKEGAEDYVDEAPAPGEAPRRGKGGERAPGEELSEAPAEEAAQGGPGSKRSSGSKAGPGKGKGKGKEAPEAPARKEFRFPRAHFGDRDGEWDYVMEKMNGNKWFVFVIAALAKGEVPTAEEIRVYWLYEGRGAPELTDDRKEWIFQDRSPKRYDEFTALPKSVRDYLGELESDEGGNDAAVLREMLDRYADAQPKAGSVDRMEEPEDKTPADLEINLPKAGAKGGPRGSGGADEASLADVEAKPQEQGLGGVIRKKLRKMESELPEGVVAAMKVVELSLQNSGIGAVLESVRGGESREKAKTQAASDLKGSPARPGLSAMALAFLISELLSRVDMDCKWAAGRYCGYLSTALGGIRTEVWALRGNGWVRVACEGDGDREGEKAVQELTSRASRGEPAVWLVDGEQKTVAVKSPEGALLGAVVITGVDAGEASDAFLAANAEILVGLSTALAAA